VRGTAWSLRQLGGSRWATPEGDRHLAWVAAAEDGNWAWARSRIPAWTAEQGEAHGWCPPADNDDGRLYPWQQDMLASTAAAAARRGHADARAVLAWMENFIAGRFLAGDRGFNPRDGCAYALAYAPPATEQPPPRELGAHRRRHRRPGLVERWGLGQQRGLLRLVGPAEPLRDDRCARQRKGAARLCLA
jgi:hypothetical protein